MGRLEGKRAVVTGAGSGLGRASAIRFAEEGALVACCDVVGSAAEETAQKILADGHQAIAVTADVRNEGDTAEMVARTVEAFGGLEVLFANAGVASVGRAGDVGLEEWNRVIGINLTGVWLSCRAALAPMLAAGTGSIVCTASVGGLIGVAGIAAYAAAKAGVIGLVKQMAVDYGPEGVRVNAICPSTVPTPLVRQTYAAGGSAAAGKSGSVDEILAASIEGRFPLRRLGREEDVAAAAVYLASDESSWVTGIALAVDGGQTAH